MTGDRQKIQEELKLEKDRDCSKNLLRHLN